MKTVNIHEAETRLSRLVDEAVAGGEVVIARANRPLAKLAPLAEALAPRQPATAPARVRTRDDFDSPLADFDANR